MAYNSQGVTVSIVSDIGTYSLLEVISVSIDGIKADSVEVTGKFLSGRAKAFRPADYDFGTLSVTFREQVSGLITSSLVGQSASITIGSPAGNLYSGDCIVESFAWSGSVGALQEYRAVFKLGALA